MEQELEQELDELEERILKKLEKELEDNEEILMDSCPYAISFLTEFFAIAIQMYIGCLGSVYTFGIGPIIETFSFGLGRLTCYEIFNHISPLHINPAKSFGFFLLGRMHLPRLVIYITAQYIGSIVGVAVVMAVLPPNIENVCVTGYHSISPIQAFMMETVTTMILMLVVAAATDPVNEVYMDSLSLRMGFVVLGLVLTIQPFTHAGKNPARSFSPALLSNDWHSHWLYEVGPFCGSAIGALLYRFVFDGHQKHSLHKAFLVKRRIRRRHFPKLF